MTPFDNGAFRSWPLLAVGALSFGLLFELPVVLFDYLVEETVILTPAAFLMGIGGFVGYFCIGVFIKTFGEVSD